MRDCSHFLKLGREESIKQLVEHEGDGTLLEFIKKVAPDYVEGQEVQNFILCDDANLWG